MNGAAAIYALAQWKRDSPVSYKLQVRILYAWQNGSNLSLVFSERVSVNCDPSTVFSSTDNRFQITMCRHSDMLKPMNTVWRQSGWPEASRMAVWQAVYMHDEGRFIMPQTGRCPIPNDVSSRSQPAAQDDICLFYAS